MDHLEQNGVVAMTVTVTANAADDVNVFIYFTCFISFHRGVYLVFFISHFLIVICFPCRNSHIIFAMDVIYFSTDVFSFAVFFGTEF